MEVFAIFTGCNSAGKCKLRSLATKRNANNNRGMLNRSFFADRRESPSAQDEKKAFMNS